MKDSELKRLERGCGVVVVGALLTFAAVVVTGFLYLRGASW